jgi:CRP/FNR family cyclic AMP-dependent transcriptional regulator
MELSSPRRLGSLRGMTMLDQTQDNDVFKQQLRDSLRRETRGCRSITISRHANIYNCGDMGATIYFIESGQVKLVTVSPDGRECIVAIYAAGDVFGEMCITGSGERLETATAMETTELKLIPLSNLFARLSNESLLEGFARYLAARIAVQTQVISDLVMVDCEHRLGMILLQLARRVGVGDPRSVRIEKRISHQELSAMVGTTRPRITAFMQRFRELGLVDKSAERFLVVRQDKLTNYLTQTA